MKKNSIISVSQLNFYAKSLLDGDPVLSEIFVCGEISNLTDHYRSGHLYFSLKDEKSVVRAVMFAGNASKLRFKPEEGMSVIAIGRVSLYETTGQFQLYIEQMQPEGIGELAVAFNQLKLKLEKEGLFDENIKKEIPDFPKKIGVITSDTGAVRHDVETVLSRRFPIAEMILYPSAVQGENAVPQLIKGIQYFNNQKNVDVIIIGRGGGSMEDLWAFNSELLAREIYKSKIPVISAVGHATDYTICDFVADKSAPTPSAAAEIAVPDISELFSKIMYLNDKMADNIKYIINSQQQYTDNLADRLVVMSGNYKISEMKANLENLIIRLNNSYTNLLQNKTEKLKENIAKLNTLSPLNILSRGYAIITNNNVIVKSVNDINIDDKITVKVNDGDFICTINEKGAR
ncbi:MAG: exodeoxyribonuclease VII large subunit [Acutalibacteraceae bacterium]|nr:exodeoxyribonuclease VII large subunit [Acutalibacteraceae bacterium]